MNWPMQGCYGECGRPQDAGLHPIPQYSSQGKGRGLAATVAKPIQLEKPPVKRRSFPGVIAADNIILYEERRHSIDRRLEVTCPLILREAVLEKLNAVDAPTQSLRELVDGLDRAGTSTRIEDHRLALVTPRDEIDIYDAVPTTRGVFFYGTLDLHEDRTALLWSCGSCRNDEDDLIHNAMDRVICKLALLPSISHANLASQLAPSTKFEAFSLLLNVMQTVKLLDNEYREEEGRRP